VNEPEEATESKPLWRDLVLVTWGADLLQCPCCKGAMRKVETLIQPEKIEKRRRLVGVLDRNPRSG
jgi:hypothetical protein